MQTTIKDLKNQVKERSAEVEVLKEMVKASNLTVKAKEIDLQRLSKRLNRLGERQPSASSGTRQ
jgi:tRNA(Phe) wybutosine-synthesizing methylase Tyw3